MRFLALVFVLSTEAAQAQELPDFSPIFIAMSAWDKCVDRKYAMRAFQAVNQQRLVSRATLAEEAFVDCQTEEAAITALFTSKESAARFARYKVVRKGYLGQ
jgi:hypothetical protein